LQAAFIKAQPENLNEKERWEQAAF